MWHMRWFPSLLFFLPKTCHGFIITGTTCSTERRPKPSLLRDKHGPLLSSSSSSADNTTTTTTSKNSNAQDLQEKAQALRKEIEQFEQQKRTAAEQEKQRQKQVQAEQQALRERYSAVVPILKPNGSTQLERCDFRPRYKDGSSFIITCEAFLPLGMILGESEDFDQATVVVVDHVSPDSHGAAAGVQVGDILHACTACKVEMEMPTWQILAGGIGMPKTKRFMYQADGRPFEEVLGAIASNRQDPEGRPVLLVLERRRE